MYTLVNRYILPAVAAIVMTTTVQAQQNLNAEQLQGLELDYMSQLSTNGVDVFTDLTYWNLFTVRQHGWNGGSGASSILLPDGNTLWTFGDSFFGIVSENRNRKKYNMPHSAAMIQTGETSQDCFITLNEYVSTKRSLKGNYTYWGKAWVRHPDATLGQDRIDKGDIDADHFYRPEDGIVIHRNGHPVLQVLLAGYDGNGTRNETALAEFCLDGQPGDGTYMTMTALKPSIVSYTAPYGTAVLEDGAHTYLYGTVPAGQLWGDTCYPLVARTQATGMDSPWEYRIKNAGGQWTWQNTLPTDEEMKRSGIASGQRCEHPAVFSYGGKYYMCMFEKANSSLYIMESEQPYGPFMHRKKLCSMPSDQADMVRLMVHPQLSRMGELVVSYNMVPAATTVISKGSDGMAVKTIVEGPDRNHGVWVSADLQQQHFLRLFGWQKLYGIENTGPIRDAGIEAYTAGIDQATAAPHTGSRLSVWPLQTATGIDIYHEGSFSWSIAAATGTAVACGTGHNGKAHADVSQLAKGIYIVSVAGKSCKFVRK